MYTQNEMQQMVMPLLKTSGKNYQKIKKVLARKAKQKETIITQTSDGIETINKAFPGDYIVKNQTGAGEEYVLKANKFRSRYLYQKRSKDGFSEYFPIGRIRALKVTPGFLKKMKASNEFYFMASWGERMVVKLDDYLACPFDGQEIYRIAKKEFFETYKLVR